MKNNIKNSMSLHPKTWGKLVNGGTVFGVLQYSNNGNMHRKRKTEDRLYFLSVPLTRVS